MVEPFLEIERAATVLRFVEDAISNALVFERYPIAHAFASAPNWKTASPVPELSPIVVRPVFETEKSVVVAVAVEEPIAKSVVAVSPLLAEMENLANGELVPTPRKPEVGRVRAVEVAGNVPKSRLPRLNWLLAVADGKNTLLPIPIFPLPVVRLLAVTEAPNNRLE